MSEGLKIIFAGTPEFAAASLQPLIKSQHQIIAVYTQPDRPAGRGQKIKLSPVKKLALVAEIPIFQPESLSDDECKRLLNFNADVMLVSAYGLLLPQAALSSTKLGCINIHASLLPKWRGAAPIQRSILAGDTQTGITIMQMVEELDAGPVLYRSTCEIKATDTASSLHDRLAQMSAKEVVDILMCFQNHALKAIPQDAGQATYAQKIVKNEANINWQQSAVEIERKIRAFNAWPVAYTYLQGKRLRIWEASLSNTVAQLKPGSVITATKESIEVVTGEGVLRLISLQLSGGKIISAQDFINAHDLHNQCFVRNTEETVLRA